MNSVMFARLHPQLETLDSGRREAVATTRRFTNILLYYLCMTLQYGYHKRNPSKRD